MARRNCPLSAPMWEWGEAAGELQAERGKIVTLALWREMPRLSSRLGRQPTKAFADSIVPDTARSPKLKLLGIGEIFCSRSGIEARRVHSLSYQTGRIRLQQSSGCGPRRLDKSCILASAWRLYAHRSCNSACARFASKGEQISRVRRDVASSKAAA